ncbi:TPA: hypothetical protein DCZ39_06875 [Patescibacteria group bacterium]|nr:hypothetical protein [Candidatus Gracilibacteria bacterium]
MTSISSGDFSELTGLQMLYLDGNKIASVTSGDFS